MIFNMESIISMPVNLPSNKRFEASPRMIAIGFHMEQSGK
jgi:hypothetical protein